MKIRPFARSDLTELADLFAEHAAYEGIAYRGRGGLSALAELIFGEPPRIFGWLVEDAGRIGGYMTATIDYSTLNAAPFVYMDCLYLRPAYRSRGLGKRFMELLQTFAQEMNCEEIQWHTPPNNELGIGFYRRIGAREAPKVRFFLSSGSAE